MKVCSCCRVEKPKADFHRNTTKKDGLQAYCKPCLMKRNSANRKANPERTKQYAANWYEANRAVAIRIARSWAQRNKERVAARVSLRDAEKLRARPAWADRDDIDCWYHVAQVLSRGGVQFHVDHIVPLRSPLVCGLHNEFNLRVIPGSENTRKGNRYWPDMPGKTTE